jgi:hypothetical protein
MSFTLLFSVVVGMYFLPTIVGVVRGKQNWGAILVLNLLLGWTLVGWVVALTWACTVDTQMVVGGPIHQTVNLPPQPNPLQAEATKKCPHCFSDIPSAATVCRFCAREVAAV